jgi:hypothetical protein
LPGPGHLKTALGPQHPRVLNCRKNLESLLRLLNSATDITNVSTWRGCTMPDDHYGHCPKSHQSSPFLLEFESGEVNLRFTRHGLVGQFATRFEVSTVYSRIER